MSQDRQTLRIMAQILGQTDAPQEVIDATIADIENQFGAFNTDKFLEFVAEAKKRKQNRDQIWGIERND